MSRGKDRQKYQECEYERVPVRAINCGLCRYWDAWNEGGKYTAGNRKEEGRNVLEGRV